MIGWSWRILQFSEINIKGFFSISCRWIVGLPVFSAVEREGRGRMNEVDSGKEKRGKRYLKEVDSGEENWWTDEADNGEKIIDG